MGKIILDVKNLIKNYYTEGKKKNIISNLSLQVKEGEIVCILGKSGCGKTTLLKMIAGFENYESGEIIVDDKPYKHISKKVLLVYQELNQIFPWKTVFSNIYFAIKKGNGSLTKDQIRDKVIATIKMVHLEGFENYYPNKLSGGMKQRVALARALALNPDILLLDEPFSALDEKTRNIMQRLIVEISLKHKKTMVFVTHNIQEALAIGNRIIILKDGSIVENITNDRNDITTEDFYNKYSQLFRRLEC